MIIIVSTSLLLVIACEKLRMITELNFSCSNLFISHTCSHLIAHGANGASRSAAGIIEALITTR